MTYIDTAAIRAAMEADPWHDGCQYVLPLCDALDAARATIGQMAVTREKRAEAAEARIAAALDWHKVCGEDHDQYCLCGATWPCLTWRALTT